MEENKEPPAKTEPSPDATAAELQRVRSRNKILKIATIVFSTLFVLLLCAVIFIYQKISALKDALMPPTETFQDSAFRMGEAARPGELPQAFRGLISSTQSTGGSSLTVFTNAGEYSQESGGGMNPEDGEKITRVMAKYADRPIVKDFIAELKKDPEFAAAFKEKGGNPLAMLGSIQKNKNIQGLATKFVMRSDFMPFMMEVMKDPDLQPLLNKMPAGSMGSMSQMLKMMPGASQPRGAVPARAPAKPQPEESAAPEQNAGEPVQVDDTAIKPSQPSAGTAIKKKTPPPPAD